MELATSGYPRSKSFIGCATEDRGGKSSEKNAWDLWVWPRAQWSRKMVIKHVTERAVHVMGDFIGHYKDYGCYWMKLDACMRMIPMF